MINAGKHETLLSKLDDWTVTTRDLSLSAQFEHTLGVTKDGAEIFTLSPKNWHSHLIIRFFKLCYTATILDLEES
ncbi:methionine aminopeptidase [Trichonephila clavata]|uniref:Methionine aminopeptidase n=1 Tax=Trichonephila clavata TaxID=2740835 RepID=A0A8X6GVS0_TRICU|nr:methionine aminopeptidase [Trichonephila clavata]